MIDMRVPRAPLTVRGRRSQHGGTEPEGAVPSAAPGGGGARFHAAGAAAGEERA